MLRAFLIAAAVPLLSGAQITLNGAIDIHAHADPDGTPRSIDAIDLAKLAKSRGMRAIVLKNHYEPTASLAYIVRKEVPGIEVFGGVSLDLSLGGVNPAAVEWMTKVKGGYGRIVWMPTFDSEFNAAKEGRPFAPVAKDGKLLPTTVQVISIVAKNNLVLETGHSSPAEALLIIQEAKRQGVANVVVTHAMATQVGMSVNECKQAAALGAFIEFVWVRPGTPRFIEMANAIREIGPQRVIISSDLGQASNPLHPDGLLTFYQALNASGFSQAEINLMAKSNPAQVLGLK
jgi:hypothetical protein